MLFAPQRLEVPLNHRVAGVNNIQQQQRFTNRNATYTTFCVGMCVYVVLVHLLEKLNSFIEVTLATDNGTRRLPLAEVTGFQSYAIISLPVSL